MSPSIGCPRRSTGVRQAAGGLYGSAQVWLRVLQVNESGGCRRGGYCPAVAAGVVGGRSRCPHGCVGSLLRAWLDPAGLGRFRHATWRRSTSSRKDVAAGRADGRASTELVRSCSAWTFAAIFGWRLAAAGSLSIAAGTNLVRPVLATRPGTASWWFALVYQRPFPQPSGSPFGGDTGRWWSSLRSPLSAWGLPIDRPGRCVNSLLGSPYQGELLGEGLWRSW